MGEALAALTFNAEIERDSGADTTQHSVGLIVSDRCEIPSQEHKREKYDRSFPGHHLTPFQPSE